MSNIVFLGYGGVDYVLNYTGPTSTTSAYAAGTFSGANGISFEPDGTVTMYPPGSSAEITNSGQSGSAPWKWTDNVGSGVGANFEMRGIQQSGNITGVYNSWVSLSSVRTVWTNFSNPTLGREGVVRVEIREVLKPTNIITIDIYIRVFVRRSVAWSAPTTYTQTQTEGSGSYMSGFGVIIDGRVSRIKSTPSTPGNNAEIVGAWANPLDPPLSNPDRFQIKFSQVSGSPVNLAGLSLDTWYTPGWDPGVGSPSARLISASGSFLTCVVNVQIRRGVTVLLNQNITINVGS